MSSLLKNVASSGLSFQSSSGKSSSCEDHHPSSNDQNGIYSSYNDPTTKEYNGMNHSNQAKINLRNTFISPELAYNNEKKKFFEKIGYNRRNTKQFP